MSRAIICCDRPVLFCKCWPSGHQSAPARTALAHVLPNTDSPSAVHNILPLAA